MNTRDDSILQLIYFLFRILNALLPILSSVGISSPFDLQRILFTYARDINQIKYLTEIVIIKDKMEFRSQLTCAKTKMRGFQKNPLKSF